MVLWGLARAIRRRSPEIVLFAGDARPECFGMGALATLGWRQAWAGLSRRVLAVPGNHDYRTPTSRPWSWRGRWAGSPGFRGHESGAFLLRLAPLTILGLDTGPRADGIADEQLAWAEQELHPREVGVRIALFHAPAFPVSEHIGSSLDAHPDARDLTWARLEELGVQLVVNGHEHLYARRTVHRQRRIVQIITAGAGARLAPVLTADVDAAYAAHHAVLLHAHAEGLFGEAFTTDGTVLDRFAVVGG
jgi:3',5'-cyclic AMP phosphodiesterase CpdA